MATTTAPALDFRWTNERWFFTGTALVGAAITLIGFTPTWLLMRWFDAPPLPWIVHLHGAMYSAWIGIYLVQTTLIAAGRRDLHRQIGVGAIVLGAAMIVMGVIVSIEGARRGAGGAGRDQLAFLINPLTNIVTFAGLLGAALWQRHRAPFHKRLMLLTMLPILTTPLARISRMIGFPAPPPVGGMLLANLFMVALVIHDLRSKGRIHPATMWGGAFLLGTEALRLAIGPTEAWRSLAAKLVG